MTPTMTPAFGRDYKSKAAVLKDWHANKDFILNDITSRWDGRPANKQDFAGETVKLRFNRNRNVVVVTAEENA